ncbi:LysR family transcriptional regulator [Streptomyces sp. NPDC090493]|uniref:LysR family transcriptional regulator n=1 Tax=Streptomyces sp. NPDC090493 TaxID=3365964 RepID=UPI003813D259
MQMDLNLLTVLDALLEEGSVTGAADRLRLSAPAVSRSLGRIRRLTGDQILVRTGRTMTATPYALAVRADLHRLVQEAQGLLAPQRRLDLATLERTFTLQFHDAVTTAIGPGLLEAVRDRAPGVRLRFLAEAGTDTNDLRHGQVDIEVGATEPAAPEIRSQTLGEDRLMVAVPGDRPGGRLTLAQYAAADHVLVSRRGRLRDPVDEALEEHGLRRRTVAAVPTAAAALDFARGNDVLVTVPARMCGEAVTQRGLRLTDLPVTVAAVPLIAAWHQRYEDDHAHRWLREQVRAMIASR